MRCFEGELYAAIAHGARHLSAMPSVYSQEQAEVRVWCDCAGLAIHQASLVHHQDTVGLQQGIEAIQDAARAEICVVKQHPLPPLQGVD
jgi:hypothetical protein